MKAQYRFNVRKLSHHKRNRHLIVFLALLILFGLAIYIVLHFFVHTSTTIHPSKANVTKYSGTSATSSTLVSYTASDFSFKMSPGWSRVPVIDSPYHLYEWQSGSGANYATVDIFEDSNTANLSVNKVIIVSSNGTQISVLTDPSQNCATFTNGQKTSTLTGYPAKWDGVAFNCDLNNTSRDVVGISSAQATNSVILTGSSGDQHSFYFLYTDHSLSPDYSDFEELLSSFQLQ